MTKKLKRPLALLFSAAVFLALLMFAPAEITEGTGFGIRASAEEAGYDNGFCTAFTDEVCSNDHTDCNGYQPATLTTDKYDIDGVAGYDEVYEIGNAGQLYWFADKVNNGDTKINAVLTDNITVNTGVLNSDGTLNTTGSFKDWTPILNYTGTFDGNNKTISGLYFNNTEEVAVGLFGDINTGGTVKNVGVVDSYFNGNDYIGGVCGWNNGGTIKNCYNTGTVSGSNSIGGVCGENYGTIENCDNTGSVSGNRDIGGVCGGNTGEIRNCNNNGEVNGNYNVGGVCGGNSGTIENCYNTGKVIGSTEFVGGVCGNNDGTIENCSNNGEVNGEHNVGGVCGWNNGTITNCYNAGSVSGFGFVGGVCGNNASGTIENCYNTGGVSGTIGVGGVCGANSGAIKNCYYLDTIKSDSNATAKTAEQFNSGEVAYLLSQGENGSVWGQDLSTATNYPVLGGAKVYLTTPCPSYSNEETKAHTDEDEDGICDVCGEFADGIGAKLAGYTLSLNGNIGVNFYMELSDDIADSETAYMQFTLPNGTTETVLVTAAVTAKVDEKTYYVFSCEVAAKEMTDTIKAQMINGEQKGTVYTYTVKEYADYILDHSSDYSDNGKTVNLVKAMLNYGAYSQTYFDYNTGNLANAGLAEADKALPEITAETLKDFSASFVNDSNYEGNTAYYGSSLVLKSGTDIKHYFTPALGLESYTCSDGTNDYEVAASGSYIYVRVPNILAHNLGNNVSLTLYENEIAVGTISYSPMSYAYAVLNKYGAGEKDTLRNVVIALYDYYEKANAYRAA